MLDTIVTTLTAIDVALITALVAIRLSYMKKRRNIYDKHLKPIINLIKQIVIDSHNNVFSLKKVKKLGSLISDVLPDIEKEKLITNYNEEFMNHVQYLIQMKNKEERGENYNFEEVRKVRGWMLKQQPKEINKIYSSYLKW